MMASSETIVDLKNLEGYGIGYWLLPTPLYVTGFEKTRQLATHNWDII